MWEVLLGLCSCTPGRCKTCGCVTHMMVVEDPPWPYGINARMIITLDPGRVRLVQKDNGHTGSWAIPGVPERCPADLRCAGRQRIKTY
jgi:hypothetical protein